MSLSVFCGPFQPSLEKALLAKIRRDPPDLVRRVALVTPSRRLSERLQRLMTLESGLNLLNLRFHTLRSLASEIAGDAGGKAVLPDHYFHEKAIDLILRRAGGALTRGMTAAYRQTLGDLLEAGVDPVQLREHFGDFFDQPGDRAQIEVLLSLLVSYLETMSSVGMLPLAGLERVAAERVRVNGTALRRYSEVLLYGFCEMNGVEEDLFSALAQHLPVTAFVSYRKDRPAYRFMDRFFQVKLCAGETAPQELDPTFGDRGTPALGEAADVLFDPSRSVALEKDALKIIGVSGTRDEVWAAAKEIMRLHERPMGAVPFERIGVVARNLSPYRNDVEDIFRENAIPFSLYASEPILRHPLAKTLMSLLTLRRRDYVAETVQDVFESPYFRLDRFSRVAPGNVITASWRTLMRRQGLHSGWLQWRGKFAPWISLDFDLDPGREAGKHRRVIPAAHTREFWTWLEDLHGRLAPKVVKSWSSWVDDVHVLLQENISLPASPSLLESEVWTKIQDAVHSLGALDRLSPEVSWEDFLDAAEDRLRRLSMDTAPTGRGVRVMDATDAFGDSFQVLILLGMNEGRFPRPVREDPLLKDALRHLLQQPAGYWIMPRLSGYDREKLLFASLVASAEEQVTAIYSRSDESGRAEVPSVYLRELCRVVGRDTEVIPDERIARQPVLKLEDAAPEILSPKEIALLLPRDPRESAGFFELMGWDVDQFHGGLSRVEALKSFGEAGCMDGIVGKRDKFFARLAVSGLSPTSLDRFAACPFRFYGERVLGLAVDKEPAERGEIAPWLKGQIYHKALELYYRDLATEGFCRRSDADLARKLDAVLTEVFSEFSWQKMGLYPVLWESVRRRMTQNLRRVVLEDIAILRSSGFRPALVEEPLRAALPVKRSGPFGLVNLVGRIDRVDVDDHRRLFRVVDYKSRLGKLGRLRSLVLRGSAHQPALYLEMLSASGRFPGYAAVGTVYYSLEDHPETSGNKMVHEFSASEWKEIRKDLLRNVGTLLDLIEEGLFVIVPGSHDGPSHCSYCDLRSACRKSHPPSRWRSGNSEARRRLEEVHASGHSAPTKCSTNSDAPPTVSGKPVPPRVAKGLRNKAAKDKE